jgi:hypothetical protein
VPVALGLVIGLVLAFQAGSSNSGVDPLPLGAPVSPSLLAGAPASLATAPAAALTANANCDLIVPASPLSARGLATPYQLTGTDGLTPAESGCRMSNAAKLGAFVQATILDPATGKLSVYDPLVVTQGTRPAVKPTIPPIPADAVVTIEFGFNGKDLFPVGDQLLPRGAAGRAGKAAHSAVPGHLRQDHPVGRRYRHRPVVPGHP